ncbi:MAG: acylphosphatase [Pseudomonadota bacterium]
MKRLHLIISGRVQGVFFRAYAQDCATRLEVTGWVRNTSSGDVEILAEGEEEKLKKLLDLCKRGPEPAKVDEVKITESTATGEFRSFNIRY